MIDFFSIPTNYVYLNLLPQLPEMCLQRNDLGVSDHDECDAVLDDDGDEVARLVEKMKVGSHLHSTLHSQQKYGLPPNCQEQLIQEKYLRCCYLPLPLRLPSSKHCDDFQPKPFETTHRGHKQIYKHNALLYEKNLITNYRIQNQNTVYFDKDGQ